MDRLGYAIFWLLDRSFRRLSVETIFRLGEVLGLLGYYLAFSYRRLVLRNLTIAFGGEKSRTELRALARRHFASLGANLCASLKLPSLSREEIESRVTVEGLENLGPELGQRGGFVVVISHIGNWEMFAHVSPSMFRRPVGTVFQALSNKLLDAEVRRDRSRLGLELFERKEGLIKACRFLRDGGAVGVLVDQHAGDAGLWCPFFHRLASTSTMAAALALRTGVPLVPAAVYTDGVARWRCVVLPPLLQEGRTAEELTVLINEVLEAQVRRQPSDYFWVHNRWKLPRPKFLLATYHRGVLLPPSPVGSLQPFRILIRASNWLGDAVMNVPAVRSIKRGRPDAHVTILTPAKLAELWKREPCVDEVLSIEAGESVFSVARRLRDRFEAAILFPNSLRTALEVWVAGIPRRVGYPGHARRWLLNQVLTPKKKKQAAPPPHHAERYLALAEFVGAVRGVAEKTPSNSGKGVTEASPLKAPAPPAPAPENAVPSPHGARPVLGLCAGAEYGPAKRWPAERFGEAMVRLQEQTGCTWKLFGVARDRAIGDAVLAAAPGAAVADLIGQTSLSQLITELQGCDALVTNDTGTMHLAALLGVPTVAVFGSTEPALTGPLAEELGATGTKHHVVRHHVECSPCFLRECPRDLRCMTAITVEEVVAATASILANGQ